MIVFANLVSREMFSEHDGRCGIEMQHFLVDKTASK